MLGRTVYLRYSTSRAVAKPSSAPLRTRHLPKVASSFFHHWHHARELQDVNFAVHLPWLDRLFGTWSMPSGWPQGYGLAGGAKGWRGFWRQMVGPFVGGPADRVASDAR